MHLEDFYLQYDDSVSTCMLAMRDILLAYDKNITTVMKYKCPFFCYKGKALAYVSFNQKRKQPYLGMIDGYRLEHPKLLAESRTRIKILLLDPSRDLPITAIKKILKQALIIRNAEK